MFLEIKNVTIVPQTVLTGASIIVSVEVKETQLTIGAAVRMTLTQIQMVPLNKMR